MPDSKKITLAADGLTAVVTNAVFSDIVTTIMSSDVTLTGTYALAQKAALIVGGMAIQNNRRGYGWNPISAS